MFHHRFLNCFFKLIPVCCFVLVLGCSTTPSAVERVWMDSSTHKDNPPDWARDLKLIWEDGGNVRIKSMHTVRGDERVSGCYDLARLDAKESILTEAATDLKGSLDNAQQSINENAEVILGKVRSGEFEGRITGLRHTEQYFERYRIGDTERVDCYVLSQISRADYDRVKRTVLNQMKKVDERLREAVTQKQIRFFDKGPERREVATESDAQ